MVLLNRTLRNRRGAAAIGLAALVGVAAIGAAATMGRMMQIRTKQQKQSAGKTMAVDLVKRAMMDASGLVAAAKWVKDPIAHPEWQFIGGFTPPSHIVATTVNGRKALKITYCNVIQYTEAEKTALMTTGQEPILSACPGRSIDIFVAFSNEVVTAPGTSTPDYGKVMAYASASDISIDKALNGDTTAVVLKAVMQMPAAPTCGIGTTKQMFTDANTADVTLALTGGPQSAGTIDLVNGAGTQSTFSTFGSPPLTLGNQVVQSALACGVWRAVATVAGAGDCRTTGSMCSGPGFSYQCVSQLTEVANVPRVESLPLGVEDPTGLGSPLRINASANIPADGDVVSGRARWVSAASGAAAKLNFSDPAPVALPWIQRDLAGGNPLLKDLWELSILGFATTNPPTRLPNPAAGLYTTGAIVPAVGAYALQLDGLSYVTEVQAYKTILPYNRRFATGIVSVNIPVPPFPGVTLTASKLQVIKGESVTFTAQLSGYINHLVILDQDGAEIGRWNNMPDRGPNALAAVFNNVTGSRTTAAIVPTYGNATRQSTTYTAYAYDYFGAYPGERVATSAVTISTVPPACTLIGPSQIPAPIAGQLSPFSLILTTTGYVTESRIGRWLATGLQNMQNFGTAGGTLTTALAQNETANYVGEAFNKDVGTNLSASCVAQVQVVPPPPPPTCDLTLAPDGVGYTYDLTVKPGQTFNLRLWTFGSLRNGSLIGPIPNIAAGIQCPDGNGCYHQMTVGIPGDYTISAAVGDAYRGDAQWCTATVHVKSPKDTCNQYVHYTTGNCWKSWYAINIPRNAVLAPPKNCTGYNTKDKSSGSELGPFQKKGEDKDGTDERCGYPNPKDKDGPSVAEWIRSGKGECVAQALPKNLDGICYHLATNGTPTCGYNGVTYEVSTLVGEPGEKGTHWTAGTEECPAYSISYSPLVVDFAGTGVQLLPPGRGPKFDILGDGLTPHISWPANPEVAMHLVNYSRGKVKNIDDLFGDNTKGPDGFKAANGFKALAKFDVNKDGFIDSSDPVFKNLRLWADRNFNGIAEPDELMTMAQAKIKRFDLGYLDIVETIGFYGNLSRQRSVVELTDGKWLRVFDIYYVQRGEDL